MPQGFSNDLKSIQETADERDWSPKRVRRLVREGLPVVQIGRQSLINQQTLDKFLQERECPVVDDADEVASRKKKRPYGRQREVPDVPES